MPYAPAAPPDFGPALQNYLAKKEVEQLLAQAEEQYGAAAAAEGATSSVATELAAGGVAELGADTAVVAATPPGATLAVVAVSSYALSTQIRKIPGWDNLWKSFGADLADTFGFGGGHETVNSATKLYVADYVQHRFMAQRQREATMNALWASMHVREQQQINALARAVRAVNIGAHNADKQVLHSSHVYTDQRVAAAIAYANARAHNVGVASMAYTDKSAAAQQRYAHSIAAQAERNANAHTQREISKLRGEIPALAAAGIAASVATHLKPITQALSQLKDQVGKLQTENDECTEPMCEVVGPKSDWGKLLKRFGPAAIFALLAAIAAEHPDEVAKVAAELGTALGPVLEAAIGAALIPLGHEPVHQPAEATGALGSIPLVGGAL